MTEPQYLSGLEWGWDESVMVHVSALICGAKVRVGAHTRIDAYTVITGTVDIGERCHIGHGAAIYGGGGVIIRNATSLSGGVKVYTATDDVDSPYLANPQLIENRAKSGPVYIGSYSVVGANSVVLPGSEIMDEVQIASNSTVKGVVPIRQVWGGNPARFLKDRAKIKRVE
jgi:acetyltransferase-like isoleucine patch superfamily enzyme